MNDLFLECSVQYLNLARKYLHIGEGNIELHMAANLIYHAAQHLLYSILNNRALITNSNNSVVYLVQLIAQLVCGEPLLDTVRPYAKLIDTYNSYDLGVKVHVNELREIIEAINFVMVEIGTSKVKYDSKQPLVIYC